jgi:hypothetical protein
MHLSYGVQGGNVIGVHTCFSHIGMAVSKGVPHCNVVTYPASSLQSQSESESGPEGFGIKGSFDIYRIPGVTDSAGIGCENILFQEGFLGALDLVASTPHEGMFHGITGCPWPQLLRSIILRFSKVFLRLMLAPATDFCHKY